MVTSSGGVMWWVACRYDHEVRVAKKLEGEPDCTVPTIAHPDLMSKFDIQEIICFAK